MEVMLMFKKLLVGEEFKHYPLSHLLEEEREGGGGEGGDANKILAFPR